jgi:hypothetical protein
MMMSQEPQPERVGVANDGAVTERKPTPGAQVEIQRAGHIVRTGTVEATSPDGNRIWLAADGVELRRLFDKGEGFEIRQPSPYARKVAL